MILMCERFHLRHDYRVADGRRSIVLVVFIGGVTFAEISALRYLASKVYIKLQKFIIKEHSFCPLNPPILASAFIRKEWLMI